MHDPMSVAFEIKYPWRQRHSKSKFWPKGYRETFATIWHHDPNRGGNDDSCGWFSPPLSKRELERIHNLAWGEALEPYFFMVDAKTNDDPVLCERLIFSAFMRVSWAMKNWRVWWRAVSVEDAQRWAAESAHEYRSTLCFKSGYHSNWYKEGIPNTQEDDHFWRERQAESFFASIVSRVRRDRRWWFAHPRWHVWHWEIRIQPLMQFKRWAFSRCSKCGGRFRWGYAPCSGSWDSKGPQWFRGESGVYHQDCANIENRPLMTED